MKYKITNTKAATFTYAEDGVMLDSVLNSIAVNYPLRDIHIEVVQGKTESMRRKAKILMARDNWYSAVDKNYYKLLKIVKDYHPCAEPAFAKAFDAPNVKELRRILQETEEATSTIINPESIPNIDILKELLQ